MWLVAVGGCHPFILILMEIACPIPALWSAAGNKLPACSHFQMALGTAENAPWEGTVPLCAYLNRADNYNEICCSFSLIYSCKTEKCLCTELSLLIVLKSFGILMEIQLLFSEFPHQLCTCSFSSTLVKAKARADFHSMLFSDFPHLKITQLFWGKSGLQRTFFFSFFLRQFWYLFYCVHSSGDNYSVLSTRIRHSAEYKQWCSF